MTQAGAPPGASLDQPLPDARILVVYGLSKTGKSVDMGYGFAGATFLTPAPDGLPSAVVLTGLRPREVRVNSLRQAGDVIRKLPPRSVVAIDDASILAERSWQQAERMGMSGWDLWGFLLREMMYFRESILEGEHTALLNCHVGEPKTINGMFHPGGPEMPSLRMRRAMPHIASLVAKVEPDMTIQKPLWPYAMSVNPHDSQWTTGDRYVVIPGKCPLNIREVLRRAREVGHDLTVPPRPQGLEWLDDVAEWVCEIYTTYPTITPVQVGGMIGGQYPTTDLVQGARLHWAHRDGHARSVLRKGLGIDLDSYLAAGRQAANGAGGAGGTPTT